MSIVARSTSSFASAFFTKGSSFSSVSSFDKLTFGSASSSCYTSKRLTNVAIYNFFSSTVLVSIAIASFIWGSCSSMNVAPVVMTCMATGYELPRVEPGSFSWVG
ncbi:hypothetical protein ACFX2G_019948 [Malus domestica]